MSQKPPDRARAIQSKTKKAFDRIAHMTAHMAENRAFLAHLQREPQTSFAETLKRFQARFAAYRRNWHDIPARALREKLHGSILKQEGIVPLSVDLELSAICDLACPFCYRQHIATPDKLMKKSLVNTVIDQAAAMGVPAIKFNWRGEPLLHPYLPQAISRAKQAGILDTIINTNAVTLTEKKSRALIASGLDLMIYSFDGGAASSYEGMRPGRFRTNTFQAVYANIRRFAEIRAEMGAEFPRTRIQMLLTTETFSEQESFSRLFSDCVDDVSVKAYTERGGCLADLDEASRRKLKEFFQDTKLPDSTPYWRDMDGNLFVSKNRIPCEQPYQRIMVGYDGRAAMCCYDWGCEHPIGYLSERAIKNGEADYQAALKASKNGAKGYELIKDLRLPHPHITPPPVVQSLEEIWHGEIINKVRKKHLDGDIEAVMVCRMCPFKETYNWQKVKL